MSCLQAFHPGQNDLVLYSYRDVIMKYICLYLTQTHLRVDVITESPTDHYKKDIVNVPWFCEYSVEVYNTWINNLSRVGGDEFEPNMALIYRMTQSLSSSEPVTFTYQITPKSYVTETRLKGYLQTCNGQPSYAVHSADAELGAFDPTKHIFYKYHWMGKMFKEISRTPNGYGIDYYTFNPFDTNVRKIELVCSEYHEPDRRVVDWDKDRVTNYSFFDEWSQKVAQSGFYKLVRSTKENVIELHSDGFKQEIKMPISFVRSSNVRYAKIPRIINDAIRDHITSLTHLNISYGSMVKLRKFFRIAAVSSPDSLLKLVKERYSKIGDAFLH